MTEELGLITLAIEAMLRIDEPWDPVKQPAAIASFVYYATHVEKNSSLAGRLSTFLNRFRRDMDHCA